MQDKQIKLDTFLNTSVQLKFVQRTQSDFYY